MAKLVKTKSKAGRKSVSDPKKNIQFYCEQSIIDAVGGMEAARKLCYEAMIERKELILSKK